MKINILSHIKENIYANIYTRGDSVLVKSSFILWGKLSVLVAWKWNGSQADTN